MQLRKSVTLIIGICFSALLTFLFVVTQTLTHHNLSDLEDELIASNLKRGINAVTGITENLDLLVEDWANWDDTYNFLQGKKPDFIDLNLDPETFNALKNNLIILVSTQKKVIWGNYLPPGKDHFTPLSVDTETILQSLIGDSAVNPGGKGFKGLVALNNRIFAISTRPVLTSHYKGPSMGWLTMAKEISPAIIEELKKQTKLDLKVTQYNRPSLPDSFIKRVHQKPHEDTFPLIEKDKKTIHIIGQINDLKGNIIATMVVSSPRDIYTSGLNASLRLLVIIMLAGVGTGWLLLLFLEKKIVHRIKLLKYQINETHNTDSSDFMLIPGNDEVTDLSRSIREMLYTLHDNFSELQATQLSLSSSEEKYKSLFMNTGTPLIVVGENTMIQIANQEFHKMMKIPEGIKAEGQSWTNFFDSCELDRMKKWHYFRRRDSSLAPRSYEARYKDYNGRVRHAVLTVAMIPETQNSSISLLDITEQKKAEKELEKKAFYDSLTGLPNRQLFNDRLNHAIANANRNKTALGVMLLDIDNFKSVNDTLGHQAGDTILLAISSRISKCIRKSDTFARFAGDEFTIIIETPLDTDCIGRMANTIIADFMSPYTAEGTEFYLGVSIGVAMFPESGLTSEVLLKNADLAMYESKQKGKNQYNIFTDHLNDLAQRKITLDRDIRHALTNDTFEVFYQPKINLHDNRIYGMEALVRGRDNDGNIISPGEFIPFAEANGLIVPIDLCVLKKACKQTAQWIKEGLGHMTISVNISTRHFHRDDFISQVDDILKESNLPPSCLELEVTETAMMKDFDQAIYFLNSLRSMGISLSLDDFGTGYSSLNYLHSLPIQTLKIDKSFIDHICSSHSSTLELVKIIILISKAMDISVVAEGVETYSQQQLLQNIGCNQAQGYLFSKPLPHEEFRELLISNRS